MKMLVDLKGDSMRLTPLLTLFLLVLVALACNLSEFDNKTFNVEYTVDGTARSASLTYQNEQGGGEQETVRLPWHAVFTVRRGQFLYISAQNQGESGDVTTQIKINGHVVKTATSRGAYTIATVSDRCCEQ
jgi:hypothetical protein